MGALPWLWDRLRKPVYCTPFAAEVLKLKLAETAILDQVPLKTLPLGAVSGLAHSASSTSA